MTHYLLNVYIKDEDTTLEPEEVLDTILSQYGEYTGIPVNDYTAPNREPRFDYYTLAHRSRGYSSEYLNKIRTGEKVPFGIVAPEIGWFDKYDFCNHDYFGKYRELNERNSQLAYEFEEKILEFHQALVANGYHPIPVDFHN